MNLPSSRSDAGDIPAESPGFGVCTASWMSKVLNVQRHCGEAFEITLDQSFWRNYISKQPQGEIVWIQIGSPLRNVIRMDSYWQVNWSSLIGWEGEEYPDKVPIWETIIEGRMIVLGTELRERAYETIKRDFPRSLALLEIARLAGWIESDLGNIRAWLQDEGDNISLHYLMDMREANDPNLLARLGQVKSEGHPINWADLHREMKHGSFGETMDLRPYGFSRPKSEIPHVQQTSAKKASHVRFDAIRIAARLNALENLLALAVLDRARLDKNPLGWIAQYIANLRRGKPFVSQTPLTEDDAARLAEETHRAILEFADMLEMHLQQSQEPDRLSNNTLTRGER